MGFGEKSRGGRKKSSKMSSKMVEIKPSIRFSFAALSGVGDFFVMKTMIRSCNFVKLKYRIGF